MGNAKEFKHRNIKLILLVFLSAASYCNCVVEETVSVELYYESLCPYSANFIVNYLDKFFTNGLIDIVDLRLIPYGNARIGANDTISCQHGPYECVLNTVEACAINAWPDLIQHFPFINCIEKLVLAHEPTAWDACYKNTSLNMKLVGDCYESGYGKKLELQYATETNSLQPPHQYVPWVLLNGQPLYEDYENVEEYICKAYKGTLPEACGSLLKFESVNENVKGDGNRLTLKEALVSSI